MPGTSAKWCWPAAGCVLCVGLMAISGCGLVFAMAGGNVIQAAAIRARMLDSNAIVFQVNAVNDAALSGRSRTLYWEFLAVDPDAATVTHKITYNGAFWATSTHPFPTIGVGYYDLTQVPMTEQQARQILQDAGHGDDFFGWSLYRPLHPASCEALYAFTYADKTVTINSETEEVTVKTVEPVLAMGAAPGDDSVSRERIAAADAKIKETALSAFIVWAGGRDGGGGRWFASACSRTGQAHPLVWVEPKYRARPNPRSFAPAWPGALIDAATQDVP